MTAYILRRLLLMIPTLIGVSLLVTALLRLLPADAVDILVAGGSAQGGNAAFKELVDDRLTKAGTNPLTATNDERTKMETLVVDEQLKKNGLDPAKATDAQRKDAKNTVSENGYKDKIRENLGLDKNFIEQWSSWAWGVVRGDFGSSIIGARPVGEELSRRIPVSIELGLLGMLVSVLIALPLGIISAVKQDSWADYGLRSFAVAALSVPSFFLATIIIALASRWFNYSFPVRYEQFWVNPAVNLELVVIPAIILGIGLSGSLMRLTRAQMLEVMRQDYIRTARAKGMAQSSVVMKHAVRNALVPVVTVIGLQVPVLVGGSLVIEQIFGIPGVAQYMYTSINNRDFPGVIGVNMVVATVIVAANIVVDVAYMALDPRVRMA